MKFRHIKTIIAIQFLVLVFTGFIVYYNSLNGQFLWDDYFQVKENTFITNWQNLPKVFSQNMAAGFGYNSPYFRPLQTVTYMIDYSFWKLHEKGYHITNTVIHILVAFCIYWLISLLCQDNLASFLASLFFIVHPYYSEAVAFISDRADIQAALFLLLSMIFYMKYLNSKRKQYYFLVLLSYIFALLSKENSCIFPLLALLYHFAFFKKIEWKFFSVIAGITVFYALLRLTVLNFFYFPIPSWLVLLKRVPAFFAAIVDYLRIFFIPVHLHAEYSYRMFSFFEPKVLAGISVTVLLLYYTFMRRKSDSLIFFSICWVFIGLLPVSNIYPVSDSYMAERWFYFPSVGLIIILAGKLKDLLKEKNIRLYVICVWIFIVCIFSYFTVKQNYYWKDPVAFYKRTIEYNPVNWKIYNQLALQYARLGDVSAAEEAYKKALKIRPYEVGIYYNLWLLYDHAGEKEKAAAIYAKAERLRKDFFLSYAKLGNKYSGLGRDREAVSFYIKALELIPGDLEVTIDLANAYLIIGKYEYSIALLEKVLLVNPRLALAHNNLAVAYYYNKNYKLAILHCDKAIESGYNVSPRILSLLKSYRK